MKVLATILVGLVTAGAYSNSISSGVQPTIVFVSSISTEPATFVVEGSGGSHVVEAHATNVRGEGDARIVELVTPASLAIPPEVPFTIRFRTLEGNPLLRVTVAGSPVQGADRIRLEGGDIELVRRDSGGPVEVRRSGTVHVGGGTR